MRLYLGFDDTDEAGWPTGTGRLVRSFASGLPEGCRLWGILRHQLPREDGIPYTSNNSSACLVLEVSDPDLAVPVGDMAASHLMSHCAPGSDPGLYVALERDVPSGLVDFAVTCTGRRVSQAEALAAVRGGRLEGLGGTNDGIIGASAAVGLTVRGWSGRFIEYGTLRSLREPLTVGDLMTAGIEVVAADRDALVPQAADQVDTHGWLRPSLWGHRPVVLVSRTGPGCWETPYGKRPKHGGAGQGLGKGAGKAPEVCPDQPSAGGCSPL